MKSVLLICFDGLTIDNISCYGINQHCNNNTTIIIINLPLSRQSSTAIILCVLFTADSKDEIVPGEMQYNIGNDSNMICNFGRLQLRVGDKVKSDKFCLECSCTIPPMVHCIQYGHC